jgi:hypothetical protein
MRELTVKISGKTLLLHNGQLANPFNPAVKLIKTLSGKKKKGEGDLMQLARWEWEASLYLTEENKQRVMIPAYVLEQVLLAGAKKQKKGPSFKVAVRVRDNMPITYKGTPIEVDFKLFPNEELDKYWIEHRNISMVAVDRGRVPRCRPFFENWSGTLTIDYDEEIVGVEEVKAAVCDAGRLVGVGDWRPRHGLFSPEFLD